MLIYRHTGHWSQICLLFIEFGSFFPSAVPHTFFMVFDERLLYHSSTYFANPITKKNTFQSAVSIYLELKQQNYSF